MLKIVSLLIAVLVVLVACQPAPTPTPPPTPVPPTATTVPPTVTPSVTPTPTTNQVVFEQVWTTVRDKWVYNDDFRGINWPQVHDEYLPRVASTTTQEGFYALMHELIKKLGDYRSNYLSPQEVASANPTAVSAQTFGGIGVTLIVESEGGVILQLIQGAPAEVAGVKVGEIITAVDGLAFSNLEASSPGGGISAIRGAVGTSVHLSLQSPDGKSRSLDITRSVISSSANQGAIQVSRLPGTQVGLLQISTFASDDSPTQAKNQLQKILQSGPLDGLIIDVRVNSNAGALSDSPMFGTLALFNGGGPIGAYSGPGVNTPINIAQGQRIVALNNVPIVILTSHDTENGAEIFASGMQVLKRASILGMPSRGHTEVMNRYNLPDGSQLRLAVGIYRRPDGSSIESKGVQPDRVVDSKWYLYINNTTDDPQIKAALEELKKK